MAAVVAANGRPPVYVKAIRRRRYSGQGTRPESLRYQEKGDELTFLDRRADILGHLGVWNAA